jgi:hypothetical protein
MRERDVVVAVIVGLVGAPIGVLVFYGTFFHVATLWPAPALALAAGWLLGRRSVTWPSRVLGTFGLACVSTIGSTVLLDGLLFYLTDSG